MSFQQWHLCRLRYYSLNYASLGSPMCNICCITRLSFFYSKPEKKHPFPYRGKTVDLAEVTKLRKQRNEENETRARNKAIAQGLA
jgi:hypothetical protein